MFSNVTQPFDYYGNGIEDVAFFRFDKADDSRVANETSFERSIVIPVGLQVENIEIVTEIQKVFEKGKQIYEIVLTRGVIFNFADDFQISFEKDIWFSELINIQKGYNLIAKFNPATDFEENWTGDFNARSERTVECVTQS